MGWLLSVSLGGLALEGARGFTVLPPLLRQKSSLPFLPLVPSKSYPATAGYAASSSGEGPRAAAAPHGGGSISGHGDDTAASSRAATPASVVSSGRSSRSKRERSTAVLPLKASDSSTSGRGFGGGGDEQGDKEEDKKGGEAKVSAPQVSAPKVSAPKVSAPKVSVPTVSAPKVSAPAVSAPKVSTPTVSAPKVSAPPTPGATPTMSAPSTPGRSPEVPKPEASKPQVSKPGDSKPVVSMPGVSGGAAPKPPAATATPAGQSTAEASKDSKKGRLMSPLDMVVRPFIALASGVQKEAVAVEGELTEFQADRVKMKGTLKEAQEQLVVLQGVAAEKEKAEESAKKAKAEAAKAIDDYSKSAKKLQEEADAVRKRLEKEREAVRSSQAEAAEARKIQEKERAEAQEALSRVMAELEREKKFSKANTSDAEQARALQLAKDEINTADRARGEAEARWRAAEAKAQAVAAESAEAKARTEKEVKEARAQAAAAAVESGGRVDQNTLKRLQAELDRKVAELQEQTDKVRQLESSKARAEAVAARRDKSLQELMEKNRLRYERANQELQEEVKSLNLLKTAAAGFEEAKAKLGLVQSRSTELEKEAAALKKKVESLDKQLAKSADKSVEEALLLVSKEAALKEVEAQLTAAQERAQRAEQEANRVPGLEGQLRQEVEARELEKQRADELQAQQDREAAQNELVKERLFDLERSVEMSDWSERKLAKENEGLQGLISRNRKRFQKELARLGDASAELQEKSATLNEVEGLLAKEKQTVRGLTDQVADLKEKAELMATELGMTRDKLAQETARRLNAETALRQATDKSYIEQIKTADAAVEKARMEGKAMVEEVQTLLNKEKQAWATERSSLSSRLEEALRSTEAFSVRVKELEGITDKLRRESQQTKAEAADLRRQLDLSKKSAGEVAQDQKRLLSELEATKGVTEERNRLQKSVANLKSALKKITGNEPKESDGSYVVDDAALKEAQERLSRTAAALDGGNKTGGEEKKRAPGDETPLLKRIMRTSDH